MKKKQKTKWEKMLGPEGTPDIMVRKAIIEYFQVNWFQYDDLPVNKIKEALLIMEVESSIQEEDERKRETEK